MKNSSSMSPPPPVALTIAGSDCSAGAGAQADLKTFHHLGVYGLSAITCIVSETPLQVNHIESVAMPLLQDQIHVLLQTYPVKAIKTGLLPTRAVTIAVCEILKKLDIPLVVDPVMVASSGTQMVDNSILDVLKERLLPITSLVTPNMAEASALLDRPITDAENLEPAAQDIAEKYKTACLVKGGHLPGKEDRLDVLWHEGAAYHFTHKTVELTDGGIHGTGCSLSAAIAAELAKGKLLEVAVKKGIETVQELIAKAYHWKSPSSGELITSLGW